MSVHNSTGGRPSWEQERRSGAPMGLNAAIAAAKGYAEQKDIRSSPAGSVEPKGSEEVIDLLSGDEGDKTGVGTLVVLDDDEGAPLPGLSTLQPPTSRRSDPARETGEGTLNGSALATAEAPGPVDGVPVDDGDNKDSKRPSDGIGCPKPDIAS